MWRIYLNSATLANATHRELGKVVDGTSTRVRVQMINRWRVKMIKKGLYKVGNSPRREGEKKKEQDSNPNCSNTLEQPSYKDSTSSDWRLIEINIHALCLVVI